MFSIIPQLRPGAYPTADSAKKRRTFGGDAWAPSESVFSDMGLVAGARRAATGAEWADLQLQTGRNDATVRRLRDLCRAKAGEARVGTLSL